MPIRAKICGLTRVSDIQAAVAAGVDAIGLVFYPPSPRAVSAEQAAELVKQISPFVQAVGLFVNASIAEIRQILAVVPLDLLQLHGDETPEQCQAIGQASGRRWIKALQMHPDLDVLAEITRFAAAGASGILLDAWHPDLKGGTGHAFDWSRWPRTDLPLILAGGLTAANVSTAITQTQPYAVDVSGGVEQLDPVTGKPQKGVKDSALMQQFMVGVRHDNVR
ncbi:MAG: phosphoribosylanthranilate isomerase [Pseudomonadota bacterium]|nr:phosphoribosylanthranilate isomerase [Pseudomonadota bacterium]